ncbi:lipase maturation factor 2a isoform X1 [Coregonus clupeaformis]|uniref:lipase maturation factor 2a isoform X1 n=1 Tax=Coregonus clupeaformis TaxID=59861 RepID=UPI001E1C5A04|nr:lipase maturation factor 2a isoform X1 [Coregonus clupeaformis]
MGYITLPRRLFLWCMALIYMVAFVSLYLQIPGLYGNDGLLPARWQLRYSGKALWEQLLSSPTLLWLAPRLGLDTQTAMELLCLLGAALSLAASLLESLRDSLVFLFLWIIYLSMYQVGQVFLYFQWDSLLLETGFLCVLIAPVTSLGGWRAGREHDHVTFWLARWLLFRLMFASGVVKLTSRCPTWWGLTALTYHYETQCIPTPLAWFAHQLPVWWHKLSVVATFVIEIAAPFLFLSPLRRLRLGAFYMQVLLQVLIILSGNYNFFNLLTLTMCLSLLDDQHIYFWLRKKYTPTPNRGSSLWWWAGFVVEIAVWALIGFGTVTLFDLQINWDKGTVSSRTAFTFHQFNQFLKTVTFPSVWLGVLSLTWELVSAMFRCACVEGFFKRFLGTVQWTVFGAAAVSMFAISLVPFTYIEYDSNGSVWPGVRQGYDAVSRYQLVNSYGLFRRMTGVGGRPEVVIEGSMDKVTWTEIEFMYKPGNLSAPPSVITPHQPRLDWQMWFAALGTHTHSPWFTSLMYRLLQGKTDVIELIQSDVSQYPFHQQPPMYLRAHRYKYWFTKTLADGSYPQRWWRRVYIEEFYPTVHLGDTFLESMLSQHGLKDKSIPRRVSEAAVPQAVRWVRSQVRGVSAPLLLWSLLFCSITLCLLRGQQLEITLKTKPTAAKAEPKPTATPHHTEAKEANSNDKDGLGQRPEERKEVDAEEDERSGEDKESEREDHDVRD